MPLQATSGAASYDAFGGGVPFEPIYIEQVFQNWLYTGNGSTQTINNGIDLAGKGGLVWIKRRSGTTRDHYLNDTVQGATAFLASNQPTGTQQVGGGLTAFSASGFSLGSDSIVNGSSETYASWTFREQPKFFDVVTWNGNSVSGRQIPHSLGSVPGCIIVKVTSVAGSWFVWHRSMGGNNFYMTLNSPDPRTNGGAPYWNNTGPTDTVFTVGNDSDINQTGRSYVAYLFAHNAGGFGLTGTDNVISCGSYTVSSNVATVTLGYEPQWTLTKRTDSTDSWRINDVMRGSATEGGQNASLAPNTSNAETTGTAGTHPTSTGFTVQGVADGTYIYIAIRRGPMAVPTVGTSVFSPVAQNSAGTVTTNFPVDLMLGASRNIAHNTYALDRLRGSSTTRFAQLRTDTTSAESSGTGVGIGLDNNTGFVDNWFVPSGSGAASGSATVYWNFRRAPGFFDEVCYSGTGVDGQTFVHNLGVAPELTIIKRRSGVADWPVRALSTRILLNSSGVTAGANGSVSETSSTTFTVSEGASGFNAANASGSTYVAYLFASCPGVSKVGSVTHVEPTTVVCGFIPRFILIKSTTTTGTDDWFVFDSARGLVPGNDPYLRLNSTGAENTPFGAADLVDVTSDGFIMNGFNGGNYIYLAIA